MKTLKKVIKEIYTIIWMFIAAIGLLVFIEIGWLIVNW